MNKKQQQQQRQQQHKSTVFAPDPERFFVLRYRYYSYANVAFSFTLRYGYRSGRSVFRLRSKLRDRSGREAQLAFKDPGRHFPVPY